MKVVCELYCYNNWKYSLMQVYSVVRSIFIPLLTFERQPQMKNTVYSTYKVQWAEIIDFDMTW